MFFCFKTSTSTFLVKWLNATEAILLRASNCLFRDRGTYVMSKLSKTAIINWACSRYFLIGASLLHTSHLSSSAQPSSLRMPLSALLPILWRFIVLAEGPHIRPRCSNKGTWILVHTCPFGSVTTTPTPNPSPPDASSLYKHQKLFMAGASFTLFAFVSPIKIYVMKLAKACPLMLAHGVKRMSCSPNSMTHLVSLPVLSVCSNNCLR